MEGGDARARVEGAFRVTLPIGVIVAAVIAGAAGAASDAIGPTRARANVVGTRYVLELPNQAVSPGVAVAVILGTQGLFAGLLVASEPAASDVLYPIAIVASLFGLLIALLAVGSASFIAFDERGVDLLSPWRRGPKRILFRDIVSVRKKLLRKVYVVRTSAKQKLRIRGDLHGFATLARLLLDHLPAEARMNARTRAALDRLAQGDRG